MKEKILSAIKAKIGKTDISDKTLSAYVEVIVAQITDETQIETAIAPSVIALKEIQANINSVAANAARAKEAELKAATPPAVPPTPPAPDDTPAWAKGILETNKALAERLAAIEGEKVQQTQSQKLAEKLKDVPEWHKSPIIAGRTFKDDAELEAFAGTVVSGWEAAKQTLANQGFQHAAPPEQGAGSPVNDVSSIVSQIEAVTKEIEEKQTKK